MRPEHLLGAANELLAAQHFLSLGYQVYFPVVQQGPVDFVIEIDDLLERVQVKTATQNLSDGRTYLQARTRRFNSRENGPLSDTCDLLVCVYQEELWIIPASKIASSNICLRTSKKESEQWADYKVR